MLVRYLTSPLRLLLGLPPVYGITLGNRVQQLARAAGLYRGPIHYRCKVDAVHLGAKIGPVGHADS